MNKIRLYLELVTRGFPLSHLEPVRLPEYIDGAGGVGRLTCLLPKQQIVAADPHYFSPSFSDTYLTFLTLHVKCAVAADPHPTNCFM